MANLSRAIWSGSELTRKGEMFINLILIVLPNILAKLNATNHFISITLLKLSCKISKHLVVI